MDRFRVRALEKILATEYLTKKQKLAVEEELKLKLSILGRGFSKHHPGEHNPFDERLQCLDKNPSVDPMVGDLAN